MGPDLEHRVLARFDEIECHVDEIVSWRDKPAMAFFDGRPLLQALDERLAALADALDDDDRLGSR